jgi:hypothetical protein
LEDLLSQISKPASFWNTHPSPLPQENASIKAHRTSIYGGCHKWRDLQNGWFIMKNPMKMDDWENNPIILGNLHISPDWEKGKI